MGERSAVTATATVTTIAATVLISSVRFVNFNCPQSKQIFFLQRLTTMATFLLLFSTFFLLLRAVARAQYNMYPPPYNYNNNNFYNNDRQLQQRSLFPMRGFEQQQFPQQQSPYGRQSSFSPYSQPPQSPAARFPGPAAFGPSLYSRGNYGGAGDVYGAVDKIAAPVPYNTPQYGSTTSNYVQPPFKQPITYYSKPLPLPSFKNTSPAQSAANGWGGYQPGFYRPVWQDDYSAVVQAIGSSYATMGISRDVYVPRAPPPVYGDLGALSQHPIISELNARDVLKQTALGDFKLTADAFTTAAPEVTTAAAANSTEAPAVSTAAPTAREISLSSSSSSTAAAAAPTSTAAVAPAASVGSETPGCSFTSANPSACVQDSAASAAAVAPTTTMTIDISTMPAKNAEEQHSSSSSGGLMSLETASAAQPPSSSSSFSSSKAAEQFSPPSAQQAAAPPSQQFNDAAASKSSSSSSFSLFQQMAGGNDNKDKVSFTTSDKMNVIHIGSDSSLNMTELLFVLSAAKASGQMNNMNEPTLTIVKQRGSMSSVMSVPTALLRTMTPFNTAMQPQPQEPQSAQSNNNNIAEQQQEQNVAPEPIITSASDEEIQRQTTAQLLKEPLVHPNFPYSNNNNNERQSEEKTEIEGSTTTSTVAPSAAADSVSTGASVESSTEKSAPQWMHFANDAPIRHPAFPGAGVRIIPALSPSSKFSPSRSVLPPNEALNARVNLPSFKDYVISIASETQQQPSSSTTTTVTPPKNTDKTESESTTTTSADVSSPSSSSVLNPGEESPTVDSQQTDDAVQNILTAMNSDEKEEAEKEKKIIKNDGTTSSGIKWGRWVPVPHNARNNNSGGIREKAKLLTLDDFLKPLIAVRANKPVVVQAS